MFVDNTDPITFAQLAHPFTKQGMTEASYKRRFRIPLDYKDIINPAFASEVVGYRCLIGWYHRGRPSLQRANA
jgi:hypothetical protein